MKVLNIKGYAVLIGYNLEGQCVYSDCLELSDYYDGDHPWDESEKVKKMKLIKVKGYLFDSAGVLDQEFESNFNLDTGIYSGGFAKFADGTIRKD